MNKTPAIKPSRTSHSQGRTGWLAGRVTPRTYRTRPDGGGKRPDELSVGEKVEPQTWIETTLWTVAAP